MLKAPTFSSWSFFFEKIADLAGKFSNQPFLLPYLLKTYT
jgi:hypothetical protein